ncbi:EF-hand calcium-binding domain-containing protein 12-like [Ylistrum balloti]|uniref:EF-hand calcium-binding domain-containing protein 12-like n=1 Tax=Ylistrum balloti TaxID=509963 RepID=UPI002905ABBE|nr:EF-hand calcium-binding domain-containing protein 12-like [Ylistrum balloti]
MPPHRGGPVDAMDSDITFPLQRLFDEYNLDHIPEDERMSLFKHRDLPHIKHYKAAVKIFGGPLSRKRVIVAPPMETKMRHRLGLYLNQKPKPAPISINTEIQPQEPLVDKPEYDPEEIQKEVEKDKEFQYKKWIQERQKFRNNIENMGLSEDWLRNKPKKTALEKRVLHRMEQERKPKEVEMAPLPETPISAEIKSVPSVKVPSPLGIRILDLFLKRNKMRLIDLFTQTDKDKNWKLSRDEFRKSIRQSKVPLSEPLLEDLILSLDADFDEELDYKELARGLENWHRERRENRRKELSRETTSLSSKGSGSHAGSPQPALETGPEREVSDLTKATVVSGSKSAKSSVRSASKSAKSAGQGSVGTEQSRPEGQTTTVEGDVDGGKKRLDSGKESAQGSSRTVHTQSRSSTPQFLHPPEIDTRPEQMVLKSDEAMVDLRKRDREALKGSSHTLKMSPKKQQEDTPPGIIKVGDRAIDNHCMKSTLQGETATMIDKYRQLKLKEYYEITRMCQVQNTPLSKTLLERVLLHPPDHPRVSIERRVKTPGAPLLSSHHADPPKRPRTPIEVKHKDKVRRSRSGKLLIDSRHKYPQRSTVAATGTKENLSTGKAVIRRRVDCWMTFEEYDKLTSHLAIRYQQLHGTTNQNAFWPGHLLDKVRLCMPPYSEPQIADGAHSLFTHVKGEQSVYPGLQRENSAWPVNDNGYVQSGIHDPFARKYTYL